MLHRDSARLPGSCEYTRASQSCWQEGGNFVLEVSGYWGDALEEDRVFPVLGQIFNGQSETKL